MDTNIHPATQGCELVIAMTKKLESVTPVYPERCLYRVPEKIRRSNHTAYTPMVVSIGPFHLGNQRLAAMEGQKWRYLKAFLQHRNPQISMDECIDAARSWEVKAHCCYAESIHLSSDDFVQMLVLDGAFVIELFMLNYNCKVVDDNDPIYSKPWMEMDVYRDMCLLENQLPYFVIEGMFNLAFTHHRLAQVPSFLELALAYFKYPQGSAEVLEMISTSKATKHFLDVLRLRYLPTIAREQHPSCKFRNLRLRSQR